AIFPEGSEITIESLANKGSVSGVQKEYIEAANAEISKAVLVQTLTTEIGDKGSWAAAKAHNLVRGDLAAADRRRICQTFDRLSAVWTLYNFSAEAVPPRFEFVKDEDLQKERAERDKDLYAIGWQPGKSCIAREYEIPEEDFDLKHESGAEGVPPRTARCSTCGCNTKTNIFHFAPNESGLPFSSNVFVCMLPPARNAARRARRTESRRAADCGSPLRIQGTRGLFKENNRLN
ncbi:MAG: DUF935 domain-containing protein, partial [Treponema sp.]|nr:DUF935 domain-containing protein [Treponema sp.]